MAFIQEFKGAMKNGGARPNHFRVTLNNPVTGLFPEGYSFLCKAASLPASTVGDIPVMYRGREVHFAGERSFAPWTVSIINELDFGIRRSLERWMYYIQANDMTTGGERPGMYQTTLSVEQMSRDWDSVDVAMYTYTFANAYPIEIGEIGLSYDQPNMIEEFPVTFVYDYFMSF